LLRSGATFPAPPWTTTTGFRSLSISLAPFDLERCEHLHLNLSLVFWTHQNR
jgi:hypothetical protein